ncbi:hypothetical protein ACFQGR_01335 [Weissella sagaensis]|uniref:ImmA/IrrE family metallo-endopeptidase n=1 Tax=Weissella sagaensis TaxID=2559928 RepID=A0ABW1RRG7_9LACO|nr:hypothetical protein [Weissella sagaensis]
MNDFYFEKLKERQLKELEDIIDNKITNAGIEVVYVHAPTDDPDLIIPSRNLMVINLDSNVSQPIVYRKGHEFIHFLTVDIDSIKSYSYSLYCKKYEERTANQGAINLFAKIMYADLPNEARDWTKMMDLFNLPSWYDQMVIDAVYDDPKQLLMNYENEY